VVCGSVVDQKVGPVIRSCRAAVALVVVCLAAVLVVPLGATAAGAATVCPSGPTLEGVDVSDFNGVVDWPQVAGTGRKFAYAKALEGVSIRDAQFVANYAGIESAGMKAGAYHLYRPVADATAQAQLFLERLQEVGYGAGDLIPVIDVELTDGQPLADVVAGLEKMVSVVQAGIGTAPMIYASPSFWAAIGAPPAFGANPLWIANYGVACPDVPNPSWTNWSFWQHSESGSVAGISGPADLDRFNGTTLPMAPNAAPHLYAATPPTPASVGAPYSYAVKATGVPKPTYSLASGALPPGLSLSPSGAISGTPSAAGTYPFTLRADNGVAPAAVSDSTSVIIVSAPPAARYHSLVPVRVLDSRGVLGGWNGRLQAGAPRGLTVTGPPSGIPATASAVVMNVTVTEADAGSFLTTWPGGTPKPNSSNLNFGVGQTVPNLVTVKIGTGGTVLFGNAIGSVHVVADVVGYFDDGVGPGELYNGLTPARLLDSRGTNGGWNHRLDSGSANTRTLAVAGRGLVPADAKSAVLNVTATASDSGSFLQVWPTGSDRPTASNLNFGPGQTIPNLVIVKLGPDGSVSFYNNVGSTHVVVDVVGWFGTTGSAFYSLPTPTRVLDSRVANGLAGRWQPGQIRALDLTNRNGIPTTARGVVINTTATAGTANSFVTVFPDGAPLPTASNLNFGAGETVPNLVMVQVPASGRIAFANAAGLVNLLADAVGYFGPPPS
jgi:GH25 family lysozyme M1 (1,4-beta-N-acetylmuramidase)